MLQTIYTIKNEYQLFHQSIDNGWNRSKCLTSIYRMKKKIALIYFHDKWNIVYEVHDLASYLTWNYKCNLASFVHNLCGLNKIQNKRSYSWKFNENADEELTPNHIY